MHNLKMVSTLVVRFYTVLNWLAEEKVVLRNTHGLGLCSLALCVCVSHTFTTIHISHSHVSYIFWRTKVCKYATYTILCLVLLKKIKFLSNSCNVKTHISIAWESEFTITSLVHGMLVIFFICHFMWKRAVFGCCCCCCCLRCSVIESQDLKFWWCGTEIERRCNMICKPRVWRVLVNI